MHHQGSWIKKRKKEKEREKKKSEESEQINSKERHLVRTTKRWC
jgi:hypothetical protein